MDLSGYVIPELNMTQNRHSKYALAKPGTGWFMHNNHLYLLNATKIVKVLLNALYDNPEDIYTINCPGGHGANCCADYFSEEFPIDSDLVDPMYRLTIELLMQGMRMPIDTENNAKDVETAQGNQ